MKVVYILIFVLLILIIIYLLAHINIKIETMVDVPYDSNLRWTAACDDAVKGTIGDVLRDYSFTKDTDKWKLYFPCDYSLSDDEFKKLPPKSDARYFIIDNADEMASKNWLWKNLVAKYGLEKASVMTPITYALDNENDIKRFEHDYSSNKVYILKKNIQRQEGLLITRDKQVILNGRTNGYVVVQELLQDPFIISGRKTNMRFYVLVICNKTDFDVYVYNNGFMYYTKDPFVLNSTEIAPNITTGYIDRQVYKENPLTHDDLKTYLDNPERQLSIEELRIRNDGQLISDIYFNRIYKLLRDSFISFIGKVGKQAKDNNIYFQLFGVDVAVNNKLIPKIIEINKGPDLGAKDERDSQLKHALTIDIFKKIGGLPENNNGFIKIIDFSYGGVNKLYQYEV